MPKTLLFNKKRQALVASDPLSGVVTRKEDLKSAKRIREENSPPKKRGDKVEEKIGCGCSNSGRNKTRNVM